MVTNNDLEQDSVNAFIKQLMRYLTRKERQKFDDLLAETGDPLQVIIDALHSYLADDISVAQLRQCIQKASELGILNTTQSTQPRPYVTSEEAIRVANEVGQSALHGNETSNNPMSDLVKVLMDSIKQQIINDMKSKLPGIIQSNAVAQQSGNGTNKVVTQGDEDVIG